MNVSGALPLRPWPASLSAAGFSPERDSAVESRGLESETKLWRRFVRPAMSRPVSGAYAGSRVPSGS